MQRDRLLDLRLSGAISNELFMKRNNTIENELFDISRERKSYDRAEMKKKAQKVFELAGSLSKAYQLAHDDLKAKIIRS